MTTVKLGGWALLTLGSLLVLLTGISAYYFLLPALQPGVERQGILFAGAAWQGWLALALAALIILYGVNTAAGGIRQIEVGRQQRDRWTLLVNLILLLGLSMGPLRVIHHLMK